MKKTKDLKVNLAGMELKNPIIPASGCFSFGKEYSTYYDLNILGSFATKGTTREERFGNPTPRIAECTMGLLNSVGLQNPGIDHVCKYEIPEIKNYFKGKVIANISGFSIDEYMECAKKVGELDNVGIVEVNISCPNVHNGGMAFGTDPKNAYEVSKEVKKVCKKPIFIKLSPNVTDIVSIAKACEEGGADGICLINTLKGMRIDIKKRKPILKQKIGGFSGPAIFPVALMMVYQVHKEVNLPIIGLGGVNDAYSVIEMMMAGATAVEIGSENLVNPYVCKEIIEDLENVMEELNIDSLSDIIGIVD